MSNQDMVEELRQRRARVLQMGGPEKVALLHAQGHLDTRQRIEKLLDRGSFRELGMLAHSDMPGMEERSPTDGCIDGFGTIDGRLVVISADDSTIMAGTGGRTGQKKRSRDTGQWAHENGCPLVLLVDYGGARMPDIMGSAGLASYGLSQTNFLRDRRVPVATAVLGECFGAACFSGILADFTVQVKGACMAVSGPRVLEVALSEEVSYEELGGWELHARETGQIDRVAEGDEEALSLIKEFLSYMPSHCDETPPVVPCTDGDVDARQEQLLGILPDRLDRAYDMYEIISVLVDDGRYLSLKPDFGPSLLTCLGRVNGETVGFIANQPLFYGGAIDTDGCDKATSFICLCDSFHIPLVFLHDTPGFLVGREAERNRVPTKLMAMQQALDHATVPKIAVIIRKSYGMAFFSMCGTGHADHLVAWPTAQISFMAPEAGVNVVYARKLAKTPHAEAEKGRLIEQWRIDATPWRAAGLHMLDNVIEPQETRQNIIDIIKLARAGRRRGMSKRLLANWPTSF